MFFQEDHVLKYSKYRITRNNTGTSLITIASKCRVVITSLFENHSFDSLPISGKTSTNETEDDCTKISQQQSRHLTPNALRGVHVVTTTTTLSHTQTTGDIIREEHSIISWLQDRWTQLKTSIQILDDQLLAELTLLDQEGRDLRHKENENCTRELAVLSEESSFFETESLQLTEEGLALRQLQLRASQEIRLFGEEKSISRVETVEDSREVLRLAALKIEQSAVSLKNRMIRGGKEGRHLQ